MIVTFDFDGTLTRKDVQEYFLELIERGVDVWILTSRYDDLHKHRYPKNPTNEDLWQVVSDLNFPRHKVRFTNMELKADYLEPTDVIWHLDDDIVELKAIQKECSTKAISVNGNWKSKCERFLLPL